MQMDNLTLEEQIFVRYIATERSSNRLLFYFSVLVAPVGIAVFGVLRQDYIALGVGFAGLLAFVFWIASSDLRQTQLLKTICAKILANESQA